QTFGIESPQSAQVSPELKQAIQQTMGEVLQQFIVTGVLAGEGQHLTTVNQPEAGAPQEDGVDFDELAALGELMDESEIAA
ncbi:MAG: hypothetical protein F6K11_11990, partial [Leptolyngbya sp. SIO3F4]|nr:hypothetical protein [Leptolyngbya sp. SIO3F4]